MNNELPTTDQEAQRVLNEIVLDYMKEKKRRRRFRWIMRSLILLVIILGLYFYFLKKDETGINIKPHVGLVDLNGEISDTKANADDFTQSMDNAYKNSGLKALIIRINSPGGSPVQAEYMYNTILHYRNKYPEIKIYAVCVDLCASAAYYVAVAAEEIYASPASMVGSIGVIYNGFGFVDLINKIGVTRRIQTAGSNKGFMDPFSPVEESQRKKLQVMLDQIHQQFINRVKEGRGDKLHINEDTFSGLIWTGEQSLAVGLIDGLASSGQVAREKIGIDYLVDYTKKPNLFDRMNKSLGTAMAEQLVTSLLKIQS